MSRLKNLSIAAVAVLAIAGCGSGGSDGGGDGGGDGPSVEILKPADGDTVSVPFAVAVDSSEELGPTDTGAHHVHLYIDGDDSVYEVIESGNGEDFEVGADSPVLEGLAPGEHTLNISLRNADHSAAGAEAEVTVTIETDGSAPNGDTDAPGGY